jgi:hypothetical protein
MDGCIVDYTQYGRMYTVDYTHSLHPLMEDVDIRAQCETELRVT